MNSIQSILALNKAQMVGVHGNARRALDRLEISKFLALRFEAYNQLRLHLFHPERVPSLRNAGAMTGEVVARLVELGWLKALDRGHSVVVLNQQLGEPDVQLYLRGHWLEEYLFCALKHAGSEECYYNQKIQWGDSAAPSLFEVDVIGRSENRLVFVSCKAINPRASAGMSTELRAFMSEALSWDHLFARGEAAVIVATTADFIDERRKALRFAPLIEQASYLGEVLIGEEHLPWDVLLAICQTILVGGMPDVEAVLKP